MQPEFENLNSKDVQLAIIDEQIAELTCQSQQS